MSIETKKQKIAEEIEVEHILSDIQKAWDELSIYGRTEGEGPLLEQWNTLWSLLVNAKYHAQALVDFKAKIKAFVIEEVAREILVPHGIDLRKITDKYESDEC